MTRNILKTIKKSALFSALAVGATSATNQAVVATAKCTVNGREVPCEELGRQVKGIVGWVAGVFLIIAAIGIWATVFWIMMIVHAAKHQIEDKAMWIILMVFTGIVGALIYYFVVKRKFNKQASPTASQPPS